MAREIFERFGYRPHDTSRLARRTTDHGMCPFVGDACTKSGGVCSVQPSDEPIIVCPKRLYFGGHKFLREIARTAFGQFDLNCDPSGLPTLTPGHKASKVAFELDKPQVGVFGQGWSGEIKLPSAVPGGGRYSVDFTLVVIDSDGTLLSFVPVEVQTIDTTGSYRPSIISLEKGEPQAPSNFGMNWENVNKRILPQLIVKGLMLQGERLCPSGIFFVTPEPVYDRIMRRLGGPERLRRIPMQAGSITFIRYLYGLPELGKPQDLRPTEPLTISTSDLSLAFISPENLPAAGSYERIINEKLKSTTTNSRHDRL